MSPRMSFRRAAFCLAGLLTIAPLSAQQVVFTEVMYNPTEGFPEFVEILNNTATPLDMALWRIKDGIDYTFPDFNRADPQASFMRAYERLIVAAVSEADFREVYPEIPDDIRIFGPWDGIDEAGLREEGFLDNAGETITLVDKNGSLRCTLDYEDDGLWSVAADGGGHSLHVINSNLLIDDFHNWRASAKKGGSPGLPDPDPVLSVVLSEVQFDAEGVLAWVEVYNAGNGTVDLSALAVASDGIAVKSSLAGSVAPGAYASHDVALEGIDDGKVFLVDAEENVLDAHVFKRTTIDSVYQTYPAGSSEWYLTDTSTRDAANAPAIRDEVVISEIMFAPPIGSAGEFVELHNRSDAPVDISGWRLDEAIRYTFPSGTSIPAGGYVVVAGDLAWFNENYGGDISVMGNFDGGLSNDGELIRLEDATGNLADVVDYGVGGVWPWETDDFGSSLELVHPDMDNNRPSAWKASDESNKSEMREYTATLAYLRPEWQAGGPGGDQELHFHLIGEGYLILDNVEFQKPSGIFNPNPQNLIENGDQESQTGRSDDGWLFQGTHSLGFLQGTQLHIISTGRGDNRANRVEIDVENLGTSSSDLTLSFQARWIYGKPRLIAQTIDHGWSYEFLIDEPTDLGTPGAANTAAQGEPAPQVDYLLHSPAVPKSTDEIVITAHVHSATPLQRVQVAYIDDSAGGNMESLFRQWRRDPMFDDGMNGDAVAGDGVYTYRLQGDSNSSFKKDGAIVVFYVEVIAENGETCTVPPLGSDRPAIYIVDDQQVNSELRTMRMVMSQYDTGAFGHSGNVAKYDYKYPSSSNFYRNCTIIMNESEIFYGCEARSAGSPWHENDRANLALKGKYKMPKSNAWRGIIKNTYDQDASIADRRHNDRLTRYWLYLLGHAANDNEFIRVIVNDASPQLREEVEPVDNTFLNRHFVNGSHGQLFRVDDQWMFTDTWGRSPLDATWDYKAIAGERAGRYHSEYMLRSREVEYDYSALIGLFKTVTEDNYTEDQIARLIDIDQMALNFAVRGYIGDWDFISLRRGKNTFFYRQPDSGQFSFLHWDSDLAYQSTSEAVIQGTGTSLRRFHTKPYFRQKFNHYLKRILDDYNVSGPRVNAWLEMEDSATSEVSANISKYRNWETGRASRIRSEIGDALTAPFQITTEGGNDFDTTEDIITLEGTADAEVYEVIVLDDDKPRMEWIGETEWRLSNIVLTEGANTLRIRATNSEGKLLGSLFSPKSIDITVTKTTPSHPIVHIDAEPASYNVSLSQELQLDAGQSYDPEGDSLTYAWEGSSPIGYGLNIDGDAAKITFDMPGIYTFQVTAADGDGNSTLARREASVYGPEGFSNFSGNLEAFWQTENVDRLGTSFQKSYYQLDDREGFLMLQVVGSEDGPSPLAVPNDSHPAIVRSVPAIADWAFQSKYLLTTRQLGDFKAGVFVQVETDGGPERYFFGHDQGTHLAVYRMGATGGAANLEEMLWDAERATVRIRRVGNQLQFHYQRKDDTWQSLHMVSLEAAAETTQAGLFVSTNEPVGVKIGFDYAMLIEPGTVSSLQEDLRVTEIMYNPDGGQEYEFLELFNAGTQPLDLTGAHFTDGIDYTFGEVMLQSGQYLILAKNPVAFVQRYGADLNVAESGYGGQLANEGETVTLVDSEDRFIFSISYDNGGDWPAGADGTGASLELIDTDQSLNSSLNWQASSEVNGTPGRGTEPPSEDDKDGDGMLDAWETAYGLDPENAQDAFQDLDGDGWNNREEFISGTEPDDPTRYLAVSIDRVISDTVQLSFNGLAGRAYTIEYTDALDSNTWTQAASVQPENDGEIEREAAAGVGERYFRIAVRPAPEG